MATTQLKFLLMFVCILVLQTTTGVYGQCSKPPINQAVYEGTQNTIMTCTSPTKVSWTLKPTTDELGTYKITNYDDNVTSAYTNLFGVNSTVLNIKKAQSNATTPPISTAALYIININGSATKFGAKLTVVRQPPTCNCTTNNSTNISITCSLTYADSVYHPVAAKMTWTSNGNFYANDTPVRSKVYPYYVSTSVITVDAYDSANYQCNVTFAKPTNIQFAFVATNYPEFSAACNPPFCGNTSTTLPTSTTQPSTTTLPPTTTTTECTPCPSPDPYCIPSNECPTDGTNMTYIYGEFVMKAELYVRYDSCCPEEMVCGVVVTTKNDSRWLIHDPQCYDNKCEMVAVNATCMSNNWKLFSDRKVTISGVGDYVQVGNSVYSSLNMTDCSESCRRMMNLM